MDWSKKEFWLRLTKTQRAKGVALGDLAERVGYANQSSLSGWAREKHPRFDKVATIAEILGVRAGWLAFGEGPPRELTDDERTWLEELSALPEEHRHAVRTIVASLQGAPPPPAPVQEPSPVAGEQADEVKDTPYESADLPPIPQIADTRSVLEALMEHAAYGAELDLDPSIRQKVSPFRPAGASETISRHTTGMADG